jgi:LPXTG-motif cell wall-anchored protein
LTVRVTLALAIALLAALSWSAVAHAQSADDQYDEPAAPSGPAAEAECSVFDDTDGEVNSGDTVVCEGDYVVAEGASVTLEDSDGTQGTFVDGQNAEITEGSLIIDVAGDPLNVVGGNEVLNTEGLFVVATTGISAADDDGGADEVVADDGAAGDSGAAAEAGDETAAAGEDSGAQPAGASVGVLPDTGGPIVLGLLGVVSLLGGGLLVVRRRLSSSE